MRDWISMSNRAVDYRLAGRPRLAFAWWGRAATAGDGDAWLEVGYALQHGIGVRQDPIRAARAYRRAIRTHIRLLWHMATSTDVTLRTAYLTAAFCSVVAALYATVAIEPAPVLLLFISFAPVTAVCLWLQRDAGRTGVGNIQDWGFFLWLFWPVLIPWYAFKTRGPSGWRLAAGLLGLAWAPLITAGALSLLFYGLSLFRDGPG